MNLLSFPGKRKWCLKKNFNASFIGVLYYSYNLTIYSKERRLWCINTFPNRKQNNRANCRKIIQIPSSKKAPFMLLSQDLGSRKHPFWFCCAILKFLAAKNWYGPKLCPVHNGTKVFISHFWNNFNVLTISIGNYMIYAAVFFFLIDIDWLWVKNFCLPHPQQIVPSATFFSRYKL